MNQVRTTGAEALAWASGQMPVLKGLREELIAGQALKGVRIAVVFHVSLQVAALLVALRDGGAEVRAVPSKVATIESLAVEGLRSQGLNIATPSDEAARADCLQSLLEFEPHLLIDNADLFRLWHRTSYPPPVIGATAHSRSACVKIEEHLLINPEILFPVITVGSSSVKLDLESQFGTGQSVVNALIRATGWQLCGKRVLVVGYGNVGKGIARFLRGLNAHVIIAQNSAVRKLHAVMDGYEVAPLHRAIEFADVVITATGARSVIGEAEFHAMRDGTYLGNVGNSQDEIEVDTLQRISTASRQVEANLVEYQIDGKRILLMGDGHQFNHMYGSANTSDVMDLSLSIHVLAIRHLLKGHGEIPNALLPVPRSMEEQVARTRLIHLGFEVEG
jgi:adenosylhomocysteinase